ncbi:hypothetical protein Tco_0850632 [Tanacetum coccineum]
MTHPSPKRNMVPKTVLMRSGLVSLTTARPVNTAQPKTTVNSARPMTNVFNKAHSTVRRPINNITATKNNNFNKRVNTVSGKNVNTARPKAVVNAARPKAVLNAVKGNQVTAVKASACCISPINSASLSISSTHSPELSTTTSCFTISVFTVCDTLSDQTNSTIINTFSITYPSNEYQSSVHHNVYSPQSSILQLEYAPTTYQHQQSEFSQPDPGLIVLVVQKGDDLIDAINYMMSFLTAVVTSRCPTTNNQLRTSSNPHQQATIYDGKVTVQPIQGRQTTYCNIREFSKFLKEI